MLTKIFFILRQISLKTIYFNLKYLPFRQAVLLPIFVSKRVYLRQTKGRIELSHPITTGKIKIGYGDTGIFDNKRSRAVWNVVGTVRFEGRAFIGHGSKISVGETGYLKLGKNFKITAESSIVASKANVIFGDNCLLSWDTLIMDTDFHKVFDKEGNLINTPKDITIGNDVWVGCRCLILKGTQITNNCIVAANTTITGANLNEGNAIYGGQPLRKLKQDVTWLP